MKRYIFLLIICMICPLWVMSQQLTIHTTSSARLHNAGETTGFQSMSAAPYAIGSTAPSFSLTSPIGNTAGSFMGKTSIPQSHIYSPFSDESPAVRRSPGSGHSGGTEEEPPDLDPIGEGTTTMLVLALLYLTLTILIRCKKHFIQ